MPGPTQDPVADFGALLDGQTFSGLTLALGGAAADNLRFGRPALFGKTIAGVAPVPSPCVFVNVSGGPPPRGYFGTARSSDFVCRLEVYVRGSRSDVNGARTIARALLAFLHHREVATYVSVRAEMSEPLFDDETSADHPVFLCPFSVTYHA